jgi:hypothetical protein
MPAHSAEGECPKVHIGNWDKTMRGFSVALLARNRCLTEAGWNESAASGRADAQPGNSCNDNTLRKIRLVVFAPLQPLLLQFVGGALEFNRPVYPNSVCYPNS